MTFFTPKGLGGSFNVFSTNQTLKYWRHLKNNTYLTNFIKVKIYNYFLIIKWSDSKNKAEVRKLFRQIDKL